jgi:thymidylate kinase
MGMLVLVEGIDRVGKTTLARRLENLGFLYLKDRFLSSQVLKDDFDSFSAGKVETAITLIDTLVNKENKNVVMDRLHLTELVYGTCNEGRSPKTNVLYELDNMIAKLIPRNLLVFMCPTDMHEANERAGENQVSKQEMFVALTHVSAMNVIKCSYNHIDEDVTLISHYAFDYDIYFASPFFNDEQVEREERLKAHLRGMGYSVYSPKEACHLNATASPSERLMVFNDNCIAINNSAMVFAVTDGKDMGTIWEAGYARGINKPVAYYAETLGTNPFNLMLAQSGFMTFRNQYEIMPNLVLTASHGINKPFSGDIE